MKIGVLAGGFADGSALEAFASAVEDHGYDSLWVGGGGGVDIVPQIARIAAATQTLELGAAVLTIWSRLAVTSRMSARSLSYLSGGRFTLGLGVSLPEAFDDETIWLKPLTAMREYLAAYRKLTEIGPDAPEPDLVLAAMRPKMLELARTETDGVVLYITPPARVKAIAEELGDGKRVVVSVAVSLAEDETAARQRASEYVAAHLAAPTYHAIIGSHGYADELEPPSERLVDDLVVTSETALIERLAELERYGATEVLLQTIDGDPWPTPSLETLLRVPLEKARATRIS